MSEILLLDELVKRLKILFQDYSLLNKAGILQTLQIFSQYLPQPAGITITERKSGVKNYSDEDFTNNFPCVIVQLGEVTDREELEINRSVCRVNLITGIYDALPECQGYRDVLNIQDRIRTELLTSRVIAERFRLRMPLKSKLLDVESWPVYYGVQELEFDIGRPVMRGFVDKPIKERRL